MNTASANISTKPSQNGEALLEGYSVALHTINDIETLIEFSIEAALTVVNAHAGSLFLWDEFQKELVLRAARGPYRSHSENARLKLREGISGWVGERGEPVVVSDIHEDRRFGVMRRHDHYRSYSFIAVPLTIENKLVGVLNITERQNFFPFSQNDLQRVQLLAHHIATAYDHLMETERLRRDNEAMHHTTASLQERIRLQESMESVGKLATGLAHELNNPLDAIRRYVNLALDQAGEDSLMREYLLKSKKGIRRAIRIIRGLLQFSRDTHKHQSGRTAEVHEIVRLSLEALRQDPAFERIQVKEDFHAGTSYVNDLGLELVLRNLYKNAQQAMNGSGSLTLSTRRDDSWIYLRVSDTGTGIPETVQQRLFEPFFTTKGEGDGVGIGLTLCREIIERSGGSISLE